MPERTGTHLSAEKVWRLNDEKEFLERSLADTEQEHAAGDLNTEDYALLRKRDEKLLFNVQRQLSELKNASLIDESQNELKAEPGDLENSRGGARKRRRWLAIVGTAAIIAAVVLLVVSVTSKRLPGQSASGGLSLSGSELVNEQLAQAATLMNKEQLVTAMKIYDTVLSKDPKEPEALAEAGWLEWESGTQGSVKDLSQLGDAMLQKSAHLDPSFYVARFYLATIDEQEKSYQAASIQYEAFLADHPPASWIKTASVGIRATFTELHLKVPAGL